MNTGNSQDNNKSTERTDFIVFVLQIICGLGFVISLVVTAGILLFNLSKGCEFIPLIDDMVFGVGISFLFLLAAAISDLFT